MPIARRAILYSAGVTLAARSLGAQRLRRRPNVVLVLARDFAYGDLSLHGNKVLRTPVLDQLAASGADLTRFIISPDAAPTMASLLTGRYSQRTGVHGDAGGREVLPATETTIARALRLAGYHTALAGPWRLGSHYPNRAAVHGFDRHIPATTEQAITAAALDYIDERLDPFFLALDYDLTTHLDSQAGRILVRLNQSGLAFDTIVIVLSLAGPLAPRYNAGLRGLAGGIYEGSTRVPFLIRWPGHIQPGTTVEALTGHIDLYPTLLELCRAPQPDEALPIDGASFAGLLTGENPRWENRPLFVHPAASDAAQTLYPGAVRSPQFNLVNGTECYDLSNDAGEYTNVAAEHTRDVTRLRTIYEAWFRSVMPHSGFVRAAVPVGYSGEDPVLMTAAEAVAANRLALTWEIDVVSPGRYRVEVRSGAGSRTDEVRTGAIVVKTPGTLDLARGRHVIETRLTPGAPADVSLALYRLAP